MTDTNGGKKRILITSTDVMMLQFLAAHAFKLLDAGYYVEVACSDVEGHIAELKELFGDKVKLNLLELKRSPYRPSNLKGYKQLKALINTGNFDLIWTNEPVMGVMTRLAARKARKKGTKIIYIAHGFHFFKGASLKNWAVFYPIEKFMCRYTNCLITINSEDYTFARKHFNVKRIVKFPGIGVDISRFRPINVDRVNKCNELSIPPDSFIFLSVGELEKRKNHSTAISAFYKADIKNSVLLICGVGSQKEALEKQIEQLGLQNRVKLLGYRYDVSQLLSLADVFVFISFQEGLSVALMEAMANGITCVVSKIRGNVDLIDEGKGIFCNPCSVQSCSNGLTKAVEFDNNVADYNREKVNQFDFSLVNSLMMNEINGLLG